MKLTKALKQWLVDNASVKADASDDEFRSAATKQIAEGKLDAATFAKLCSEATESDQGPGERAKALIENAMTKSIQPFADRLSAIEKRLEGDANADDDADADDDDDDDDGDNLEKTVSTIVESAVDRCMKKLKKMKTKAEVDSEVESDDDSDDSDDNDDDSDGEYKVDGSTIVKMFTGSDSSDKKTYGMPRVKEAVERYDGTKSAAVHPETSKHMHLRGRRLNTGKHGHDIDNLSERDRAVGGAWFKLSVNSAMGHRGVPHQWKMTEHDNQLVLWAIHNERFTGLINYRGEDQDEGKYAVNNRKLTDFERKALLDDLVSGGLESAPVVVDDAFIITPLLHSELFPLIDLVNLTRGRRVEGWSIGNPTITSGVAEGTEIPLFNTASLIAAFDTTIYNAVGSMELGLDFEEDTPANIMDIVVQRYGEAYLQWLDEQIAMGDGTIEPEGVTNASGINNIPSDNGAAGPPTLSDYEMLLFGIDKEYRTASTRTRQVYISNDTTYQRSRSLKVDPASPSTDERRLLGMDHESYSTLGHPHKICNQLSNAVAAFVNLRYYRMYRRLGLAVRVERGGKDLVSRNVEYITVRARFGGRLELAGAAAIIDDMKS